MTHRCLDRFRSMAPRAIEHLPIFVIYYRSCLVNREVYDPLVKPRARDTCIIGAQSVREFAPLSRVAGGHFAARNLSSPYFASSVAFRNDRLDTIVPGRSLTSNGLFALSYYQSRGLRVLIISRARWRARDSQNRKEKFANETICGRTHILFESPLSVAIIPSSGICRTRIQEVHFRRH